MSYEHEWRERAEKTTEERVTTEPGNLRKWIVGWRKYDWAELYLLAVFAFVVVVCVAIFFATPSPAPHSKNRWLRVETDPATGCEYLLHAYAGGITPRVDGRGRHMGCKQEAGNDE